MHINYFIVVKRQEKKIVCNKNKQEKKSYATISISRKNPIKR